MKILLTGANGYVGSRLLPALLKEGHEVIRAVRHDLFPIANSSRVSTMEVDLLKPETLNKLPQDIEAAYYLVHSMTGGSRDFPKLEQASIDNFLHYLSKTSIKHLIYLSGFAHTPPLSPHLASRYAVEKAIRASDIPYTVLRAGIIIGSGSASFEIIRDLTEKLPLMVAPKWVLNRCQPIAIQDVLFYLKAVLKNPLTLNGVFDIAGPDKLSYKDMLLEYASVRHLKRKLFVVPVLTPRLSSYWLYFITSVNFELASSLVDSIKNETIASQNSIDPLLPHTCLTYRESLQKALNFVDEIDSAPSWKDTLISEPSAARFTKEAKAPVFGCLTDCRRVSSPLPTEEVIHNLWSIGGKNGWYFMDWAWEVRGFLDKIVGGVGLQRGRTHPTDLHPGSSLDFWRVLIADKKAGHLLLFAEMKLPGEAWLEFVVQPQGEGSLLVQTAYFRPKGVWGRLYWILMTPFHQLIFQGMAKEIATKRVS